ncbi:Uncharacterised protein [Achromobacter spanius]|uniref:hypothetical protein n=1 Tax=Achromobacter spanius TaxID=217203 RepID=UPI000C2C3CCD|nr:hypothetical protein [Achromobacter spanius]AUA57465.1 hypothetical protein CVS48_16445 [Achromobacter spanius]CAB3628773.1 hypothetical protein LMG5911_00811 [Achromobacter spanius]SPT37492.1 Uncharacterised protein [Achromobacter denitrificans]VEE54815.1 Uncharacterised protein [Achromobacter spanius]
MNQKQRTTKRRRIPRKAWALGLAIAAVAGFYAWNETPLGPGLTERKIHKILVAAMATPTNAPGSACVKVVGVRPLPANVYTTFLEQQDKIVQGLIKHQLITVKRISANGDGSPPKPDEDPEEATSRMELTEKGRAYYAESETLIGSDMYYSAKFCAPGLQVGKILDYSKPGKNPFDDNPNAVSAVHFEWRLDRATADWAADPVFYPQINAFPSESPPEEWPTRHIMLERKNGVWGLGDRPYTIRW